LLGKLQNIEIKYISAGKYSLKLDGREIKKVDSTLREIVEKLEKDAKKQGLTFSIPKK